MRSFDISSFWRQRSSQFAALVALLCLVSACATPIGVTRMDAVAAQQILTANALSAGEQSSFSKQVLHRLDLHERFESDPVGALQAIQKGLPPKEAENRIFALAELSFLHAQKSGDRPYYLAAVVYAYAYLFPGEDGARPNIIDPRLRLAVDLYNRGLTAAFASPDGEQVMLKGGRFPLPFGELDIKLDEKGFTWAGYRLDRFVAAAELDVRGLENRYRRVGIGAPLAATLVPAGSTPTKESVRIPPRLKVPVTAFLRLDNARRNLSTGNLSGTLSLHNPDSPQSVTVEGLELPLEDETTSALAYTLEGAPVWDFEIAGFRAGDFRLLAPQGYEMAQDGLFMMQPHRAGRIPVVLVHGTASSPARWAELFNELENDPRVDQRYEIWLFTYNTGNPIAYSALLLREALSKAVAELDPEGKDPGLQRMVVIGHSQGGLLTKMTVIDSATRFWDAVSDVPFDEVDLSSETRDLLKRALFVKSLPFVRRVVFIATPHHGSYQAAGFLGRIGSWLVNLPGNFARLSGELLTLRAEGILRTPLARVPSSIDNMNPSNPFLQTLASIPLADGVIAHSIIAVQGDGPPEKGNDGVVAYESAHIDGVESEKVVRSGHSTQSNPHTIEEVKRILIEHAKGP